MRPGIWLHWPTSVSSISKPNNNPLPNLNLSIMVSNTLPLSHHAKKKKIQRSDEVGRDLRRLSCLITLLHQGHLEHVAQDYIHISRCGLISVHWCQVFSHSSTFHFSFYGSYLQYSYLGFSLYWILMPTLTLRIMTMSLSKRPAIS